MNDNRLPPGYVPLTIHELSMQPNKQGPRNRPDGDRPRRNNNSGGSKPKGRMNNNKRRPPRQEDREPIEE